MNAMAFPSKPTSSLGPTWLKSGCAWLYSRFALSQVPVQNDTRKIVQLELSPRQQAHWDRKSPSPQAPEPKKSRSCQPSSGYFPL
jgi:hypothetical protein